MLLAFALAGAVVSAAPATPMTLAQAIDFAEAHNQSVLSARAQWVAAGSSLARDRANQLPLVQGVAQNTLSRSGNAGPQSTGIASLPNYANNTTELLGSQSVYNLQNELLANQSRHAYDQAAQNLRLVREQTTVSVETSFYNYVQNVDLVAIAQADLQYQNALFQIADANYKSGRVAGIDRLKAQVQVTSSEESLASAQADAEDSRENLAQLIGADATQQFVVPAAIPAPPAPSTDQKALLAIALANRPDIAIERDGLDIDVLANGLIDAPNRPTVALQGGTGAEATPTLGIPSTHFYSIQLTSTLSLPLLDWGTLHSAHKSEHAAIDAASAALDAARRQAAIDVDQAVRRLKVDEQNLTLATQNADVAKQAAQISQVQYKVGLGSQTDVQSAEQTYLQAAKQLLAAQIGYVLQIDKLKQATGTLVN